MSGNIVEVLPNQTYLVRMDGSGRISRRHRQYLKAVKLYSPNEIEHDNATETTNHKNSEKNTGNKPDESPPRRSSRLVRGGGVNRAP